MTDSPVHEVLLEALIKGNRLKSTEIINDLLKQKILIEDIYEQVIKLAMYRIGDMWESGTISVATEHLASAIIEAELNTLYSNVLVEKSINKTVVVACVEREYHQIGAKMVADVFELNGWNTYYLGSNMPGNELIAFIKSVNPDLVALSLSIYFNLTTLEKLLHSLQTEFPNLHVLIGGQAFLHGGKEVLANYRNSSYLPDLYTLESYITNTHSLH